MRSTLSEVNCTNLIFALRLEGRAIELERFAAKQFLYGPDIKCPFRRVPYPSSGEEMVERIKKRAEMDDANAIFAT